jgi:hypothetical protein
MKDTTSPGVQSGGVTSWPDLPGELASLTMSPDDPGYREVRSSYMGVGSPRAVVMAHSESDVAAAVRYAVDVRGQTGVRVPFSVRSGGHGIAGTSTNNGGIIVDLSALNRIEVVDPVAGLVRVQAGAHWGAVAASLTPHDLVMTSGNFGDVGVGGLTTAGGHGYFVRSQGLTLDRVRRVRLLTADGQIRWVDAGHEPELFWAVRGGATQVGIALEFEFEAARMNSTSGRAGIIWQEIQYLIDDLGRFTAEWGDWMREAPREAVSFLMVQRLGDGRYLGEAKTMWANDDPEAATPTLNSALQLAGVLEQSAVITEYPQVIPTPSWPHRGQQREVMRDVLVDKPTQEVGQALAQTLENPAVALGEIRALGGAESDVDHGATAWAGRHQEALIGIWAKPRPEAEIDEAFGSVQALGTGMYGAYSSDTRDSVAKLAWPGATGDRLRAIATQADPGYLFDRGLTARGHYGCSTGAH